MFWDCRAPELLGNIKDMLEHSEGEYDIIVIEIMKELRSVSWHWSSWSSRAIEVLRPPNDLLETLL